MTATSRAAGASKPKAAVFPLAGSASVEFRQQVGFALRKKLDRDGTYEVIEGPDMADLAAAAEKPVDLHTAAEVVKKLAAPAGAAVLIWGQVDQSDSRKIIRLNLLDLRQKDGKPRQIDKEIAEPTDLRFAIEEVLQTLPGVKPFEHPSESSVIDDPLARKLWRQGPNLVPDGDFSAAGRWTALYRSEEYPVQISGAMPGIDKVNIHEYPGGGGEKPHNVLAMRLSKDAAESDGLACLSQLIPIQPGTRYRLQFRYRSDGPSIHVFVKGYAKAPTATVRGELIKREIYRRQVPPAGPTNGKWITITDDLNPQHPDLRVEGLRIDLYAYLSPGLVMFDGVTLKAVGKQDQKRHEGT